MEKKNLAIIGASYLQLPLIEKAKEMGFITHVFAWAANDIGEDAADFFYPISITEKERIAEECKKIGICGICSIATDLGAVTVNYVANRLGLPGNSAECTLASTNKGVMRKMFKMRGDPSPISIMVDGNTDLKDLNLTYPVIVKPTDRSGSRGIFLVENFGQLEHAVLNALNQGFEKKALIESYARGKEYSVEGISYQGQHHILAITEKFTTGVPNFIETGHMQPAILDQSISDKVRSVIIHALDSLKIENSASHSEIKIDDDGNISIIEIGARMGGDCIGSDLVPYSTGIDFLKAVIQVSCGEEPDLTVKSAPVPVKIVFLFTEDDVRKMEEIKHTDRFIRMVAYFPENIGHTTDSSNRAGCYLVKA